jgi:hypothetical protein
MLMVQPMRLAAAAFLLLATSTALAQPGATSSDQTYGPPPPPPTYRAPQSYPQPAPAPAPAPQPPPYAPVGETAPYGQPAPYAPVDQPQPPQPQPYGQPYGQPQQYSPRPYYAPPPAGAPYRQAPVGAVTQPVVREIKNPGTAQLLSIGATGLGLLGFFAGADDSNDELAIAGLGLTLIGPSAGHIYAGENGHAVKMTLLRTAGLLTFVWGAVKQTSSYDCIDYCYEDDSDNEGETAMYVGGAVFVLGTLYDLYDSGRAARRFNEKAARQLTVGPTMMSAARGGGTPGVALSGSF